MKKQLQLLILLTIVVSFIQGTKLLGVLSLGTELKGKFGTTANIVTKKNKFINCTFLEILYKITY